MQTLNDAPKTKEVQSDSITMVDKGKMSKQSIFSV